MSWYYAISGQRQGPVSEDEFFRLIHAGTIHDQTLVWRQGMPDWKPYGEIAPTLVVPPPLVAVGPAVGTAIPAAIAPADTRVYAGFWLRVGASLVDFAILFFIGGFFSNLVVKAVYPEQAHLLEEPLVLQGRSTEELMEFARVFMLNSFVGMMIGLAYDLIFVPRFGATPGKMVFRLQIQRADGSRLSYLRATGRHFANMLSGILFCVGYIMVAFDDQKRGLHDIICDTRVVKKRG